MSSPRAQAAVPIEAAVGSRPAVLVVGAGPAGLVTAIEIARAGLTPLVIERHPSTSIFPRATGVSTRSMEIFRSYGIDDDVRRGGWQVIPLEASVRRLDDREPTEAPLGFPDAGAARAVSPTMAAVSPQDHLEPVLVDHLRALGGEVRFSTELVSFEQHPDGVAVTVRDLRDGTQSTIQAAYLVGADGHRSTVRTSLGIEMEGPDDLGRLLSILFRADLSEVIGETRYGLYTLPGPIGPEGPPLVVVPSGVDDRYVLGVPLPPQMDDVATAAAFSLDRCTALVRDAAGRPELDVEILATSAFAFSAQVAARWRDGRIFLVGDAAHRMTPRGGRGMNTAIADGRDLGWKLASVLTGAADAALLDSYESERGPIGRRNVGLSMAPGGGGTGDGLLEDLGPIVASSVIVAESSPNGVPMAAEYVPDAIPGGRAPHVWLMAGDGSTSRSTLDLFGGSFVLLTAGQGRAWRSAASRANHGPLAQLRLSVHSLDDAGVGAAYGLEPGGAVLVRPDGIVAWRTRRLPADATRSLAAALAVATGRATPDDRSTLTGFGPTKPSRRSRIAPAIWASLSYLAWGWAIPMTSASGASRPVTGDSGPSISADAHDRRLPFQPTGFDQQPDPQLARAAATDGGLQKPIPPRPLAWPRRLTAWLAPLALVLAFLTGAQPVLAQACVPTAAAFPPGHWVARGISVHVEDEDELSVVVVSGTGGFDLTVDDLGAAHGSFSLAGEGHVQSWQPGDDGAASASYLKTGEMSGTASVIQIDGETNVAIEGVVDVEPNHDGDLFNTSGQDLYGFGNEFTMPFTAQFSPSAASCNTVFGSLGGPVEYGTTATGGESFFLAYRDGAAPASVDVQGQLTELLEDAQFVLNMDPVDTDVLARFVLDMLQFESLLASLESCDPGSELEMGPTWQMLQSVTFNTIRRFLDAAGTGAYTTADVITAIGIWIQGGSLGWRASDCLEVNTADDGAMDLFVKFEDILLQRYQLAKDGGDIGEMKQIAAAGYQYGLSRVIAAVEAN